MDALLRFLNRPIIIKQAHPTWGMRAAFWCLLALHIAALVTTWALVGGMHAHLAHAPRKW